MIVLDASVLIAHLDAHDAHHRDAGVLLAESGSQPLGASVVTWAETLAAPARAGRLDGTRALLERLGIEELPLRSRASAALAQLRAETSCKLPGCCVLLAAQERAATVASFDETLVRAAQRLGLATLTTGFGSRRS